MSQQQLQKVQNAVAIPEPTNDVDALWRTCQALKEAVEVLQGDRGNRKAALKVEVDALSDQINSIDVTGGGGGGGTVLDTLPVINATAPTDSAEVGWFHRRIYCSAATTITFDSATLGGVADGNVMWIMANGGAVTLTTSGGTELRKFLGVATTTGDVTIADGGWATLVKVNSAAPTILHVTGVGVS